jgi:subtilisin family serine protease
MALTAGRSEVIIGLIDGPVALDHPDLAGENIREIPVRAHRACAQADAPACIHGTFTAGILSAKRGSKATAICPDCTLLSRPIFSDAVSGNERMPSATPGELAAAIIDCIEAGARVLNLSVALAQPSVNGDRKLEESLNHAARRGVVVVAAAGNQGAIGSSTITRHPWVIPVVACDLRGKPVSYSNLGTSIGKRGLSAPGDVFASPGPEGKPVRIGGTSVATPFVTGAVALLWSEFLTANAAQVKFAVLYGGARRRSSIVPPLLDAWGAHQHLSSAQLRR